VLNPFREFSKQPLQARSCAFDPPKILSRMSTGNQVRFSSGARSTLWWLHLERQFTRSVRCTRSPQPVPGWLRTTPQLIRTTPGDPSGHAGCRENAKPAEAASAGREPSTVREHLGWAVPADFGHSGHHFQSPPPCALDLLGPAQLAASALGRESGHRDARAPRSPSPWRVRSRKQGPIGATKNQTGSGWIEQKIATASPGDQQWACSRADPPEALRHFGVSLRSNEDSALRLGNGPALACSRQLAKPPSVSGFGGSPRSESVP